MLLCVLIGSVHVWNILRCIVMTRTGIDYFCINKTYICKQTSSSIIYHFIGRYCFFSFSPHTLVILSDIKNVNQWSYLPTSITSDNLKVSWLSDNMCWLKCYINEYTKFFFGQLHRSECATTVKVTSWLCCNRIYWIDELSSFCSIGNPRLTG